MNTSSQARFLRRSLMTRCLGTALLLTVSITARAAGQALASDLPMVEGEPITPIPKSPALDPGKLALGESLFQDRLLSRDGQRSCASCHDVSSNGATRNQHDPGLDGVPLPFNTSTVFNASLNFRLMWRGKLRSLEAQADASFTPVLMGISVEEAVRRLRTDAVISGRFEQSYGHGPDRSSLLDAIATYERSLLTPGSRFDLWLAGDKTVLSPQELTGYRYFKSFGCIACHQGVNIGGNLYEHYGIFHPLTPGSSDGAPKILRVPSLRNIAATGPYFHDGSAPTLQKAVRQMSLAQLNRGLSDEQIDAIVAFLHSLTGNYRGKPVNAPAP